MLNPKITTIFGYVILAIAIIVLTVMAIIEKNVKFIKEHPVRFIIETIIMTLGPAIVIMYIFKFTRGIKIRNNLSWISIMAAKLLVFHILFEISGLYDFVLKG
jgi:hypothetical protein